MGTRVTRLASVQSKTQFGQSNLPQALSLICSCAPGHLGSISFGPWTGLVNIIIGFNLHQSTIIISHLACRWRSTDPSSHFPFFARAILTYSTEYCTVASAWPPPVRSSPTATSSENFHQTQLRCIIYTFPQVRILRT